MPTATPTPITMPAIAILLLSGLALPSIRILPVDSMVEYGLAMERVEQIIVAERFEVFRLMRVGVAAEEGMR